MGCLKIHTEEIGISPLRVVYRKSMPEAKVVQRWYQVDPKAEQVGFGMSPYCAMNGNPVSYADPDGDIAPLAILPAFFSLPPEELFEVCTLNSNISLSA